MNTKVHLHIIISGTNTSKYSMHNFYERINIQVSE